MPGFGDRHPPVSVIAIHRFRRSGWSEIRSSDGDVVFRHRFNVSGVANVCARGARADVERRTFTWATVVVTPAEGRRLLTG